MALCPLWPIVTKLLHDRIKNRRGHKPFLWLVKTFTLLWNLQKATKINLLQNFAITSLCPTFILRLTQKVFIEQKIVPLLLLDISDSLEIISNKKFNKTWSKISLFDEPKLYAHTTKESQIEILEIFNNGFKFRFCGSIYKIHEKKRRGYLVHSQRGTGGSPSNSLSTSGTL